jgi:hypothetical protein
VVEVSSKRTRGDEKDLKKRDREVWKLKKTEI